MKEIKRISHHKCSKCGHEWNERLMIFGDGEVKILKKHEKVECDNCGNLFDDKKITIVENKKYCSLCYKEYIIHEQQKDCYNANEDMGL